MSLPKLGMRHVRIDESEEEIRLMKDKETYLREGSFGGMEKNVQVMMEWEREYMYACVDAVRRYRE